MKKSKLDLQVKAVLNFDTFEKYEYVFKKSVNVGVRSVK